MKITLKGIKIAHHLSDETTAFTATLYVDGKRTAHVYNRGSGGCNGYDATDNADARSRLRGADVAAQKLPPTSYHGVDLPMDLDMVCGDILTAYEEYTFFKRRSKTLTFFRVAGDPDDTYRNVTGGTAEGRSAYILRQYPDADIVDPKALREKMTLTF